MSDWMVPSRPPDLPGGEVHLWLADLDQSTVGLGELESLLTPAERAQAASFRFLPDRFRYSAARAVLRIILGTYLHSAPTAVDIRVEPTGKPRLADGSLAFTVSHTDSFALYGISRDREIGVDIERMRPGADEDVRRLLPAAAARSLEALPIAARQRAFFRAWTRMEACIKARGDELATGLNFFAAFVEPEPSVRLRSARGEVETWWLRDLAPRQGYAAAVAIRGGNCRIRCWQWQSQ